jgi:hypothetical protein
LAANALKAADDIGSVEENIEPDGKSAKFLT